MVEFKHPKHWGSAGIVSATGEGGGGGSLATSLAMTNDVFPVQLALVSPAVSEISTVTNVVCTAIFHSESGGSDIGELSRDPGIWRNRVSANSSDTTARIAVQLNHNVFAANRRVNSRLTVLAALREASVKHTGTTKEAIAVRHYTVSTNLQL